MTNKRWLNSGHTGLISKKGLLACRQGKIRAYHNFKIIYIDGQEEELIKKTSNIYYCNKNKKYYKDEGEWHHGINMNMVNYLSPIANKLALKEIKIYKLSNSKKAKQIRASRQANKPAFNYDGIYGLFLRNINKVSHNLISKQYKLLNDDCRYILHAKLNNINN